MGDAEAPTDPFLERFGTVPGVLRLVTNGRIAADDVPRLCAHLGELLERCPTVEVPLDASTLTAPDMASADALARMQLTARRRGHRLLLRSPGGRLALLLTATGLGAVLGLQSEGQAEEREEPGGVQEGVDPGDPAG